MSHGLTGNIKHSNGLLTRHKRRSELKNIERRRIKSGFPFNRKLETPEEIVKYYGEFGIVCLMCGKTLKSLGNHVNRIHGLSPDQYKIQYGLPMSRGLDCLNVENSRSSRFHKMLKDGVITRPERTPEFYKKLADLQKTAVRQPYLKIVMRRNISKTRQHIHISRKASEIVFDDSYYKNVYQLSLILDLHPFDVCKENRGFLPSKTMVRAKNRENKEFKKEYLELVEGLPFPVQAAHQVLGGRFLDKVIELVSDNYTSEEISLQLGVSLQTIANFRKKHKIPLPVRNACRRGHTYKDSSRKCYECSVINRRNKGILPRSIASHTLSEKKCANCGIDIIATRIGRSFCKPCKRKAYLESQLKYKTNNWERRKAMARETYRKRKEIKNG